MRRIPMYDVELTTTARDASGDVYPTRVGCFMLPEPTKDRIREVIETASIVEDSKVFLKALKTIPEPIPLPVSSRVPSTLEYRLGGEAVTLTVRLYWIYTE